MAFTLKLKKQPMKNGITKKTGYITRAISNGVVAFDDLTAEISHNTTFHHSEVEAIFGLAIDTITKALTEGKIVDLGKIGRIAPSVSSKWTETAEGQKLTNISKHVIYRPSKTVKNAINSATLVWATEKEVADAEKQGTTTPATGGGSGHSGSTGGELEPAG